MDEWQGESIPHVRHAVPEAVPVAASAAIPQINGSTQLLHPANKRQARLLSAGRRPSRFERPLTPLLHDAFHIVFLLHSFITYSCL